MKSGHTFKLNHYEFDCWGDQTHIFDFRWPFRRQLLRKAFFLPGSVEDEYGEVLGYYTGQIFIADMLDDQAPKGSKNFPKHRLMMSGGDYGSDPLTTLKGDPSHFSIYAFVDMESVIRWLYEKTFWTQYCVSLRDSYISANISLEEGHKLLAKLLLEEYFDRDKQAEILLSLKEG